MKMSGGVLQTHSRFQGCTCSVQGDVPRLLTNFAIGIYTTPVLKRLHRGRCRRAEISIDCSGGRIPLARGAICENLLDTADNRASRTLMEDRHGGPRWEVRPMSAAPQCRQPLDRRPVEILCSGTGQAINNEPEIWEFAAMHVVGGGRLRRPLQKIWWVDQDLAW